MSTQPNYDPESWSECLNEECGFRFYYPRGWVQIPHPSNLLLRPPDARSFITSDGGKTAQTFSPALTMILSPRGKTADRPPAIVLDDLRNSLHSFFREYRHLADQSHSLVTGQPALEISFEFLKGGRPYVAILDLAVTPQFVFMFDGSGLKADFPRHETILRQSLRSLRVS